MRLKDKVVLITASTRGIGLACVKACAKEGAAVYMAARSMERAKTVADALIAEGCDVKYVFNDATRPETFLSMVHDVVAASGRIDVLVNNFGTSNPGKDLDFAHTDPTVFLETVNLNLRSVFMASQEAAKHMAVQQGGSIINISSIHAVQSMPGYSLYAGTKGAMNASARVMALDYAPYGIRVNNICPGLIMSDVMMDEVYAFAQGEERDAFLKLLNGMQPLPPGKMDDIANAALFLASDMSSYITGQTIMVDGGASIKAH